jgi:hypothetical protein
MRSQKNQKKLLVDMDIAMDLVDIATNEYQKGPLGALSH